MRLEERTHCIHELFRLSVYLKGAHAVLELLGGFVLLSLAPAFLVLPQFIAFLSQEELREDPQDAVATFFLHMAQGLSISGDLFAAFYLLSHGVIKMILVVALLRHKVWAYPWSITVLGIFIIYQLYRFSHTHSAWLIGLSLFDVAVIYFIWQEYLLVQKHLPLPVASNEN